MVHSSKLFRVTLAIGILFFACCSKSSKQQYTPLYGKTSTIHGTVPEYIFAVHPLHNPSRFFEVYQPLVDYINKSTTEFSVRLEASRDYNSFEQKLFERKFHFALPNPYQSVQTILYGYTIFGKMGDDSRFYGIIIVHEDSTIKSVEDLRGAAISFPSKTALAAAMMPKYFLKMKGLNVEKDAECRYVGSQESSIMNVYMGKTKAGCTWPPPWESFASEHPEIAQELKVQWKTDPLINNGLVVRNDIPKSHVNIFSNALFSLHTTDEGKTILKKINLSRFVEISEKEYVTTVNNFLKKYQKQFGSLPAVGGKN